MAATGSHRPGPSRTEPPAAPNGLPAGSRVFTSRQLFGGTLGLLGIGFVAGVLAHALLSGPAIPPSPPPAPQAASSPSAPTVAPGPPRAMPTPLASLESRQAILELQSHLEHQPDDVEARLRLANALFDAGRHAEAVTEYEQVLAARPHDADVRTDLGVSLRETGQPQLAAAAFRQAIADSPRHANAHYDLGVVLAFDLHDTAGAIAAWERYLDLETNPDKIAQVRQALAELRQPPTSPVGSR